MGCNEPAEFGGYSACKKHPNHRQQPGVCPACLTEKLLKLSTITTTRLSLAPSSSFNKKFKSSSMAYYYSSSSRSSCLSYSSAASFSPPDHHHRHRRHRIASKVIGTVAFIVSGSGGLSKSRSVAAKTRVNNKKGGFWSKLLFRSRSSHMKMKSKEEASFVIE